MAGVVATGFESKSTAEIVTELEQEEKAEFGASWNVRATAFQGILNGIFGKKLAELYEVSEGVYQSFDPDGATGDALDQLCLLTGVTRLPARASVSPLTAAGDNGTAIAVGQLRVRHNVTGTFWTNTTGGTISGGTLALVVECEDTGENSALSGTLTEIETPITGLDSVTIATDAEEGRDIETDADLRLRREALLTAQGKGTIDAIRADVLNVDNVRQAFVFENITLVEDGDGRPGKSFEVVVLTGAGAVAQDILNAIWASKPVGISAYASPGAYAVTGIVTDDQGFSQTVGYTLAEPVLAYFALTAVTSSTFGATATGVANIKQALVDYGAALNVGDDVIRSVAQANAFVTGVDDVSDFRLDDSAAPVGTANIVVTGRQYADVDSSRITVTLQ
jgi:uncharacterized phage protein gp47/JayE